MRVEENLLASGERLRQAAQEAGLSRQELARSLGVSVTTIANWWNAKTFPQDSHLQQYAKVTGKTVAWLRREPEGGAVEPSSAGLSAADPDLPAPTAATAGGNAGAANGLPWVGPVPEAHLATDETAQLVVEFLPTAGMAWVMLSATEQLQILHEIVGRVLQGISQHRG